jgi:hypothetical protein
MLATIGPGWAGDGTDGPDMDRRLARGLGQMAAGLVAKIRRVLVSPKGALMPVMEDVHMKRGTAIGILVTIAIFSLLVIFDGPGRETGTIVFVATIGLLALLTSGRLAAAG